MLDHQTVATVPHIFEVTLELDNTVCSVEHVICKLSDACSFVEGVGSIKVTCTTGSSDITSPAPTDKGNE